MDRKWFRERTKLAYDLLVHAQGAVFPSALEAIKASYDDGVTDEFVKPIVID
jgi:2,3-bisphosphoglycerate-independent phosphoglycerate mutase